jgi:bacterioferritin
MKGNPKVLAELNKALREELTAINQYFLHAEMCENWGYHKLSDFIKKQSIGEMKHAEVLIERILFRMAARRCRRCSSRSAAASRR